MDAPEAVDVDMPGGHLISEATERKSGRRISGALIGLVCPIPCIKAGAFCVQTSASSSRSMVSTRMFQLINPPFITGLPSREL